MARRNEMRVIRAAWDMSQEQAAAAMGVTRQMYSLVEIGKRRGNADFWRRFQRAFGVDDAKMWRIVNDAEECEQTIN